KGKQCHASRPELGINAMKAGAELIVRLNSLYDEFSKEDPLYSPPISTFEPTKKDANVPNVNTIPGDDVFYFDCRILPEYNVEDVMSFIQDNVDKVVDKYGVSVGISSPQSVIAPPPTSETSEIVERLKENIHNVLKVEPKVMGIGGGTVASFFRRKGLPVAVWAKIDEVAHSPNEYISFEDMYKNTAVLASLMAG
ncbi:MAG: M20/M25/M40 family metallo-hydrolase, partial [candidate division Zixibacteria bacterium]|nr:M20/M25/M40 family metallo-hydrolase [candidate division Zixibacteria bacterium]